MSYIKQLDEHSCAPVALSNAMNWVGKECDMYLLKLACETTEEGTCDSNTDEVLRFLGRADALRPSGPERFKVDRLYRSIDARVGTHLAKGSGHSAIFAYREPKGTREWHLVFVTPTSGKPINVYNFSDGVDIVRHVSSSPTLHPWLWKNIDTAWLLTK